MSGEGQSDEQYLGNGGDWSENPGRHLWPSEERVVMGGGGGSGYYYGGPQLVPFCLGRNRWRDLDGRLWMKVNIKFAGNEVDVMLNAWRTAGLWKRYEELCRTFQVLTRPTITMTGGGAFAGGGLGSGGLGGRGGS